RLELKVSMATNYLETIRMMTAVGLGWTVLPKSMLADELCTLPIKGVTLQRTLGLVYHRGRSLSRAAQAFIAVLETCADPGTALGGAG
ncbi:MAG: LysR family transcriptional regulator substrate-binding protein, partial [Haliea sp.]|nr:LysR family transcriptional regulator substrate-binding protein [Haliea sp.]